jgi:diadenosine tetraphosphate (Ap4A) HIT family hydrolase
MTPEEAGEIGTILAALAAAVRATTGCERTYSITFNEAVKHLHLHVIPRHANDAATTSWALADRYRSTARGEVAPADPQIAETTAEAIARHMMEVGVVRSTALAKVGFRLPS